MTRKKAIQDSVPASFFDDLQQVYERKSETEGYWQTEGSILRKAIPKIAEDLPSNYKLLKPIAMGGSGVIVEIEDTNLELKRILKISRPVPGKEVVLAQVLQNEFENLIRLNHQNLMSILAKGNIECNNLSFPYYVMEYIPNAVECDDYIIKQSLPERDIIRILIQIFEGIAYLHKNQTLHLDIKPQNILIKSEGLPIISDFGFSKKISLTEGDTIVGGTEMFMHPEMYSFVKDAITDPNRAQGNAPRQQIKISWDLYALGKTLLYLLLKLEEQSPKTLSLYTKRYLRLLACRLLDGLNTSSELALGLPVTTYAEIKYKTVYDALIDLRKIEGSYNLKELIPELHIPPEDWIQASPTTYVPFTDRVKRVTECASFSRLANVTQLGLLSYVYPDADHKRFGHSLGTFAIVCMYVRVLYDDQLNPVFRQLMTEDDIKALLLASLLHDIGQYALAHDLEEAEYSIFSHERFTEEILVDKSSEISLVITDYWNIKPKSVIEILKAKPAQSNGSLKNRILHTLISGPIDADKLDYLRRDSKKLDLSYGEGIDFPMLLSSLTIIFKPMAGQTYAALGIYEKGKLAAESVAFARYCMFGSVYWHHTYRSIKSMIQFIAWDVIANTDSTSSLRDSLRSFVFSTTSSPSTLFSDSELDGLSRHNLGAPQIHEEDLAMLLWLARKASPQSQILLQLLLRRQVFKRLLVLTHERGGTDRSLWERLDKIYFGNDSSPRKRLNFRESFQNNLSSFVKEKCLQTTTSQIITDDAKSRFLTRCSNSVAILVDVPPERKGSSTVLEYLREEDRNHIRIDEMRSGSFEQSVVWKLLRDSYKASVGKARVLCHPEDREFLTMFLSRPDIEQLLEKTIEAF